MKEIRFLDDYDYGFYEKDGKIEDYNLFTEKQIKVIGGKFHKVKIVVSRREKEINGNGGCDGKEEGLF